MILSAALSGGLFGVILGFLNGVLIAAVTAAVRIPLTQPRFYSHALITACVLLSLIGTSGCLYLLFATDLFTNFSDPGTPGKPSGPTRMIGLLSEPGTIAVFIVAPTLLAGAVAYRASRQIMRWYIASISAPSEGIKAQMVPASMDNLWPL